jgi:hypothetical protein
LRWGEGTPTQKQLLWKKFKGATMFVIQLLFPNINVSQNFVTSATYLGFIENKDSI